jgi:hypothetical protein
MNLRLKTLRVAQQTNNPEMWARYKELRNQITAQVRAAKCKYYKGMFDEVKDCKSYWSLIIKDTEKNRIRPILGIRKENGGIEISDNGKANILNEHFSTIGEKLANECMTRLPSRIQQLT